MFASKTLGVHLVRGVAGASALAVAASLAGQHPYLALALVPVALVAFRGCPTCWVVGLVQTLALRVPHPRSCATGRCGRGLSPPSRAPRG